MLSRAGMLFCLLLPAAWGAPADSAYRMVDTNLLAAVRTGFEAAPHSAEAVQNLLTQMENNLPDDPDTWPPIFRAYRAALTGLSGKHSARPWTKYRRAKAGLAQFEGLVEAHPGSVELRLLRFSFCHGLPGFFDMSDQVIADRATLVTLLEQQADDSIPPVFRSDTIRWLLANGDPTPGERARLEALLPPTGNND